MGPTPNRTPVVPARRSLPRAARRSGRRLPTDGRGQVLKTVLPDGLAVSFDWVIRTDADELDLLWIPARMRP